MFTTTYGLEAGPLSQSLYVATHQAETSVRNALKTMQVTTDCNDGRAIAQLMRLGWFRPGQTEPRLPAGALTRPAAEQQQSCGRASGGRIGAR
jgi:hypothetical protein